MAKVGFVLYIVYLAIEISLENVCPDSDETQIIIIELKKYTFLYHRWQIWCYLWSWLLDKK